MRSGIAGVLVAAVLLGVCWAQDAATVNALFLEGMQQYRDGRMAEAADTFRRVVEMDPQHPLAGDYLERAEAAAGFETAPPPPPPPPEAPEAPATLPQPPAEPVEPAAAGAELGGSAPVGRDVFDNLGTRPSRRVSVRIATRADSEGVAAELTEPSEPMPPAAPAYTPQLPPDAPPDAVGDALRQAEFRAERLAFERAERNRLLYKQAEELFERRRYDEAVGRLNLILEQNPDHQDAKNLLAKADREIEKQRDREEADRRKELADTRKAGIRHYKRDEYDEAIKALERVLAANPDDATALEYWQLATDKAAETGPTEGRAKAGQYTAEGMRYFDQGLFEQAEKAWERVLVVLPPGDPRYRQAERLIHEARLAHVESQMRSTVSEVGLVGSDMALEPTRLWSQERRGEGSRDGLAPIAPGGPIEPGDINEAMLTRVTLSFTKADIRQVLSFLSDVSGVNIILDESVFQSEGDFFATDTYGASDTFGTGGDFGAPRAPGAGGGHFDTGYSAGAEAGYVSPEVTINIVNETPMIDVLRTVLESKGLTFRVERNAIWVTTAANMAREELTTRVFRLRTGGGVVLTTEEEGTTTSTGSGTGYDQW